MPVQSMSNSSTLADILERVLDKGIVIAGDISIAIADIDLLKIRIRLVVASVDKAEQIGINWWRTDPNFSAGPHTAQLQAENAALRQRLETIEQSLLEMTRLLAAQAGVEATTPVDDASANPTDAAET